MFWFGLVAYFVMGSFVGGVLYLCGSHVCYLWGYRNLYLVCNGALIIIFWPFMVPVVVIEFVGLLTINFKVELAIKKTFEVWLVLGVFYGCFFLISMGPVKWLHSYSTFIKAYSKFIDPLLIASSLLLVWLLTRRDVPCLGGKRRILRKIARGELREELREIELEEYRRQIKKSRQEERQREWPM